MPPLPISTGVGCLHGWRTAVESQTLFSTVLLVSLFAITLRSIARILGRRRKSVLRFDEKMEDSGMGQERLAVKKRKDSSQGGEMDVSARKQVHPDTDSKENTDSEAQRHDTAHQSSLEPNQNEYLESLKQETLEPSRSPIYPWIAPPQSLPGPYDAPYFPVPLPTIAVAETTEEGMKTEAPRDKRPEELETILYSRRIPTNISPENDTIREGVVTVSTRGWRRNQWTINAG
ncbi:hypothetical protein COCC4DRAFT_173033 [Bipolaris maydis ATCC 48331]|uniref:Uncharacterized protein n=2 Tax=Cochliobolus heterostrophus TaxID=5016 RepID=M2SRC5_COCH5|nr:uncharacterized protein COCC4DRAFT_173033 [Bipolaris maydis ATCC 48331]EMD87840.1 hypothetical protein COCHEDRAFT_1143454 [Bipolaris maydis C5]KAJ5024134.1 hypothetical protein J3E73DRAFT_425119 [Bipolaris maydis]ENI03354.1 hypothetical protein COCC4DRAFT_173033 [Bipolaris maydis ATCC 48331]KAJ5057527.1 hypothetical protein J3E74DRAFT_467362 [Bipolaris maydis]KAJ6194782.1 hypothetical protein J3E72DRAFT_247816 [Bipolaris maydis]